MDADIKHHFADQLYAKETRIPAGMVLVQHKHKTDHMSILASGRVLVEVDGERSVHEGPACLTIRAGQHHGVRALSDAVWFCIHADAIGWHEDVNVIAPDSDPEEMKAISERLAAA